MNETEPSDNGVRADLSASKYRFGEMGSSPAWACPALPASGISANGPPLDCRLVSYRDYGSSLYRWPAEWCRMTVDRVPWTRHFDTVRAFFRCVTTSLRMPKDVRYWYAQWQLVLELNGTNVQLFHFRVEGRAFHSQSVGCARCATYHSARLFQSLKDELPLDRLGHLARRWFCVPS